MSVIKLHLQDEEFSAVERYADAIGVKAEDVVYAALHRLMLQTKTEQAAIDQDIREAREWRRDNLPVWSDSARSVHAYEAKGEDPSEPSDWKT
jgi:hypothetical protein